MQTLLYILAALIVIAVILLIVLIIKVTRLSSDKNNSEINELSVKSDFILKSIGNESARIGNEVKNVSESVNAKLADVTKANYDSK